MDSGEKYLCTCFNECIYCINANTTQQMQHYEVAQTHNNVDDYPVYEQSIPEPNTEKKRKIDESAEMEQEQKRFKGKFIQVELIDK
jgi:hypothetical protein